MGKDNVRLFLSISSVLFLLAALILCYEVGFLGFYVFSLTFIGCSLHRIYMKITYGG